MKDSVIYNLYKYDDETLVPTSDFNANPEDALFWEEI